MSEMKRLIEVGCCPLRAILIPCSNCVKIDPVETAQCSFNLSLEYSSAFLRIADVCYREQTKLADSMNNY